MAEGIKQIDHTKIMKFQLCKAYSVDLYVKLERIADQANSEKRLSIIRFNFTQEWRKTIAQTYGNHHENMQI